jgi:hypothetical protein
MERGDGAALIVEIGSSGDWRVLISSLMQEVNPMPASVQKLGIRVVAESDLPAGFEEVSIPLSLWSDCQIIESMWSSLRLCGSVATVPDPARYSLSPRM